MCVPCARTYVRVCVLCAERGQSLRRSTGGAAGPARRSRSPVRGANLGGGVAGPSVRARGRGAACWARRGPGGAARVGVGSRRRVCRCAAGAVGGARGRRGRAGRPWAARLFLNLLAFRAGFFVFFGGNGDSLAITHFIRFSESSPSPYKIQGTRHPKIPRNLFAGAESSPIPPLLEIPKGGFSWPLHRLMRRES